MSNFLENLKKSLDEGKVNESVKNQFDQIVDKAEKMDNVDQLQDITIKAMKAHDSRKPLTEEERKEIEFLAMKQQQKIDEFEFKGVLGAALVNIDLVIEKLNLKIAEFVSASDKLRDPVVPVAEKKELVKDVLKEINKLEAPIAKTEKFLITKDEVLDSDGKIIDTFN